MNPILTYFKNLFVSQRVIGDNEQLKTLVEADLLLESLIAKKQLPGLAITVLKDGETIFNKGHGHADIENKKRANPQTLFRTASISKPIAATALAKMVEEGNIDLDASLYEYVPYFPQKKYDFTIRQLASHTAGIRGYKGKEYVLNKNFTIQEGINIFKDDALVFQPGTAYLYNSFDWALISLAMQEASGVPFEEYVRERVLLPLGMNNTYHDIKNVDPLGCASFYSRNKLGFRKAAEVNNFYKLAGGGFLSTTEDIIKLGKAYLDKTVGDEAVIAQFLTAGTVNGESTFYGLGWQVSFDGKGRPFYGHIGNSVGAYSNFFVYPEQHTAIAILTNCTDPKIQEELDKVVDLLLTGHENPV